MDQTWMCSSCEFIGRTTLHRTHHEIYHLMADTLLIELFNEAPSDIYPLKFKVMRRKNK